MAAMSPTCSTMPGPAMLLVSDAEASRAFYGKLGFAPVPGSDGLVLSGPFGQSLRLVASPRAGQALATPEPCGAVLRLWVADPARAVAGGAGPITAGPDGAPLYRGPDGELILLEPRGLPGAERVRLVVYDFDGVMTDNRVFVDQDGRETVAANRSDGLGVGMIRRLGVDQCILSTETNPVVLARAAKLGLDAEVAVENKKAALPALAARRGVALADVLYVGNDVNDAGAMRLAGFRVTPADAHPAVAALAGYVTLARGGHGVVRELADLLAAARA